MTDGSLTVFLHNAQQGYQVIQNVWQQAKAMLMAGHTLEFIVRKKRRSTEQNARLHAMLGDIAKQKEWAGARRDIETWKRLMTAAWLRARGEHVEMLPAIDGNGVDIVFRRTSKLSVAECSELCDFIESWAVDNDVQLAAGFYSMEEVQ